MANPSSPNPGSLTLKYIAITAATVVVGCGAWYAWGYFQAKGAMQAAADATHSSGSGSDTPGATPGLPGDTNHDGAYSNDELKAMSPSTVANINPSLLVPVYGPEFDSWRQETYDGTVKNNNFTPEQLAVIKVPTGDKASYSDQDVLNVVTLDVIDASIQDDTTDGERMLALPHSKNLREIPNDMKAIEFNQGKSQKRPVIGVFKQVGGPLPHPYGSFNGVDIGSSVYTQARVIQQELLPNQPSDVRFTSYGLYALVERGGAEAWTLLAYWTMQLSRSPSTVFNSNTETTAQPLI